jgi:hypothetical protein
MEAVRQALGRAPAVAALMGMTSIVRIYDWKTLERRPNDIFRAGVSRHRPHWL